MYTSVPNVQQMYTSVPNANVKILPPTFISLLGNELYVPLVLMACTNTREEGSLDVSFGRPLVTVTLSYHYTKLWIICF